MKKLFAISMLMMLSMFIQAQDIYFVGYYNVANGTNAALYKNGERLYTVHKPNQWTKAYRMVVDSQGNIYWWVLLYSIPDESLHHIEIWKNNQMYASTENHSEITIYDMYCLDDTLYYAGYQNNERGVSVATVWKGSDFTPHYVIGDGIHASVIYDAEVDKDTKVPYFCGYVSDSLQKACVWEESRLLFKQVPVGSQRGSVAKEISIDNGEIYTNGHVNYYTGIETISWATIWKDNSQVYYASSAYLTSLYAYQGDYYYEYLALHGWQHWINKNNGGLMQLPGQAKVQRICGGLEDIYILGKLGNKGCIWKNFQVYQEFDNCNYISDIIVFPSIIILQGSEWYYEILNDEGSFTYQHLECTGDTVMQGKRPKIIVRSNTHYNRDTITEVTHEYVYEENGKVYWWNKDLQEFTTLYDLTANTGDEWEIKVGTESLTMHVDAVETTEYEGVPYRVIHVSDLEDLFSGEIVVGFGHMTSFFPEKLMNRNANFTVDGLRCYWIGDELIYHNGEEDCDAIYTELHGVEENDGDSFVVYPNPTNGVLTVSMRLPQCDSLTTGQTKYRIINLMGQTILQGSISAENQQIDISSLPAGMYFISVDGETVKFVVK